MTLLLTCVTQHFIIQASDRRLTTLAGTVAEELANKAVILDRSATFAYTGLARMGPGMGQPTDEILLDSFAAGTHDFTDEMRTLARSATSLMRNTPLRGVPSPARPAVRRTTFVGAGFLGLRHPTRHGRRPSADDLHPMLVVVSNAQDLTGAWQPEAARGFQAYATFVAEDADFQLHTAGQALTVSERVHLERGLHRALHKVTGPEPIARLLARSIRTVSQRTATVGPNVMCTLVRRADVRSTSEHFGGGLVPITPHLMREEEYFRRPPNEQGAMWIYSPGEPTAPLHYGPNLAVGGMLMKGLLLGPSHLITLSTAAEN